MTPTFGPNVTLAFAAIREHKLRALLTVLGVIIGTGTVIGVGSILTGLDGAVTAVNCAEGDLVQPGVPLIELA